MTDASAIAEEALRELVTAPAKTDCALSDAISWASEVQMAGQLGDVVWSVAPGTCVFTRPDGSSITAADPYRIRGVLRRTQDRWLFALFSGAEPQRA